MKGVRRRIVGLFEASTDLSVAEEGGSASGSCAGSGG
jgi:hypothetical protein